MRAMQTQSVMRDFFSAVLSAVKNNILWGTNILWGD